LLVLPSLTAPPLERNGFRTPGMQQDLGRHIIVARDYTAVAQSARLSLHDEHPERPAGLGHQGTPCLLV
jgi:hypothetical protein